MKTYKLHLIRHGLTQGNLDGVFVGGNLDMPLCAEGISELKDLAARYRYPNVGCVFSSPMQRAVQSVEILFPAVAQKLMVEDLRENRFGEFEGKKAEELWDNEDFAAWLNPQSGFVPKGGESGQAFAQRTASALLAMLQHQAQQGIAEAACVTHGGVIMSMLGQLALPKKPPKEWMCPNGCGYTTSADAAMIMRDGMVEVVGMVPFGWRPGA